MVTLKRVQGIANLMGTLNTPHLIAVLFKKTRERWLALWQFL